MPVRLVALGILSALTAAATTAPAVAAVESPEAGEATGSHEAPEAVASLGAFGLEPDKEDSAPLLGLEYRFPAVGRWRIKPVVGAAATGEGASWVHAGFGRDFPVGEHWSVHLGTGAGAYFDQGTVRLGGALEFRSVAELSYRVRPDMRVGLSLGHLSNAGLARTNPGVELLTLTVAWRQPRR